MKRIKVVSGLHPDVSEAKLELVPLDMRYAHSICGSTYGIAKALRRHGYDAVMWSGVGDDVTDCDALFVSERNFMDTLLRKGLPDDLPVVLWLHDNYPGDVLTGEELRDRCAGICFTRKEAMKLFASKYGEDESKPYWAAPWGFPTWWSFPPKRESPYRPGTKNAIYAGRIVRNGRIRKWLAEVATRFDWITVHVITDCADPVVLDELRSLPRVNLVGPMSHGTFLHYLYYADVALDTGIVGDRRANNCKLWDYFAAGVPVVMDGRTGGDELFRLAGNGVIVPANATAAYLGAVERVATTWTKAKRRRTIDYMWKHWTWDAVVDRWIGRFRESVG